jgi:hypothetical protein
MDITISDEMYNEIFAVAGYPIITASDLEISADNIKSLLIWPAMREYFKFFPIQTEAQQTISTSPFEVDFPNTTTFGVLDARLSTARYTGLGVTNNPFINAQNIAISGGRRTGKYGTRYSYDFHLVRIIEDMERQSIIDTRKAFRVKVDLNNRKLKGYTNVTGKLIIVWADYSTDFSKIPFSKIDEVQKLAKANILDYLGSIRGQQNTDVPNQFNYSMFLDKAEDLREEVLDKWKRQTKVVLIRN